MRYRTPEGAEYECNSITGESRWVTHQQQHVQEQHPNRKDEGRDSNPYSIHGSRRFSYHSCSSVQPFQADAYYSSGNRAFFKPYQLLKNPTQSQLNTVYGSGGIEDGEDEKEHWLSSRGKHRNEAGGGRTSFTSLLISQLSRWALPRRETRRNNNNNDDDERPATESLRSQFASQDLFFGQMESEEGNWEDGPDTDTFISQLMSWVSSWHVVSNWSNLRGMMSPFLSLALSKELVPRCSLMAPEHHTEKKNVGADLEWFPEVQNNLA